MKYLLLCCSCFLGSTVFAQNDFKINMLGSIDYAFSKYTYNEGFTFEEEEDVDTKAPIGYSYGLSIEFPFSKVQTISSGIRFGKYNVTPRLALPWSYGTFFELENQEEVILMSTPYLAKHEIKTFSIPLTFRHYFNQEKRFSYFALVGVVAGFQYNETEAYKDLYQVNVELGYYPEYVTYEDNSFQLFNSAIEAGFGINYKLSNGLSILFQADANVLEYRKANEKFKKNGDLIWKDSFLSIGKFSLGLGLQKSF